MSHFTKIDVEIRDIKALESACDELGVSLEKNAEARGWNKNRRNGDYVIRLNGPYDIALNHQPEGHYKLETDLWNGHVEKELGKNLGRLRQSYAVHKTTGEALKKGLHVRRRTLANGTVRLALCRV